MVGTLLVGTLEQKARTEDANQKDTNKQGKNIKFGTTEEQLAIAAEEQLRSDRLLETLPGDINASNLMKEKPFRNDSKVSD